MITSQDIAARVYSLLFASSVRNYLTGTIDYNRNDYTREDIVILPRTITGEGSVRYGQINVNIHVPDLNVAGKFKPNLARFAILTPLVIEALKGHYETDKGYNWTIGFLDPPFKDTSLTTTNEHFACVKLKITVRNN